MLDCFFKKGKGQFFPWKMWRTFYKVSALQSFHEFIEGNEQEIPKPMRNKNLEKTHTKENNHTHKIVFM